MTSDVYQIITNRIIELLEQGTVPWRKPWKAGSSLSMNIVTKKPYRGINLFLLNCMPFNSPYWLTFNQAKALGGNITKGAKATMVVFWKMLQKPNMEAANDVNADQSVQQGKVPLLRFYQVFNLDQTTGIKAPMTGEAHHDHQPLPGPETIIKNMPLRPEIRFGGGKACYRPYEDLVMMPHLSTFDGPEEFYSCLYHELTHASGAKHRLGRKGVVDPSYFGSHEYSREELVAEMGAAFLCGHTGISQGTIDNSAAYLNGWLKVLKGDKTLLVHASTQAQKAADYILGVKEGGGDGNDLTA